MVKRSIGQLREGFEGLSERITKVGGVKNLNKREQANYNRWAKDPRLEGASSSLLNRGGAGGAPPAPRGGGTAPPPPSRGTMLGLPAPKNARPKSSGGGKPSTSSGDDYKGVSTKKGWGQDTASSKAGALGSWAGNNIQGSLQGGQTALGVGIGHTMRGAVGGGAIGGTMEAAQGGDFWDGAKAGAFNGAALWGGARMGMRATGATSMNPLKGINSKDPKKQGMVTAAGRMMSSVSNKPNVSRQASTLLNHQQQVGLQKSIFNSAKQS